MVIVVQLVTPLMVYYIAEEIAVSGILAVVAAGVVHGVERDRLRKTTTKLRTISDNTWQVAEYLLNGMVFVLLGYLIPQLFGYMLERATRHATFFLLISFGVVAILFVLRFFWVLLWYNKFTKMAERTGFLAPFRLENETETEHGSNFGEKKGMGRVKYAVVAAVCGVHGTFTLATALSIPLTLSKGQEFPFREEILFISCSVVLLSLILAALLLPLLLEKEKDASRMAGKEAEQYVLKEAIDLLAKEKNEAAYLILHRLEKQLAELEGKGAKPSRRKVKELVSGANKAAIKALEHYIEQEDFSEEMRQALSEFVTRTYQMQNRTNVGELFMRARLTRHMKRNRKRKERREDKNIFHGEVRNQLFELQKEATKASITYIKERMNQENRKEALCAMQLYSVPLSWMYVGKYKNERFRDALDRYYKLSYEIRRESLEELNDKGIISEEITRELRESLLYEEMQEVLH